MKKRNIFYLVVILMLTGGLAARLFFIATTDAFSAMASKSQTIEVSLYNNRGIIFDRLMRPLTINRDTSTVLVFPELIEDKQKAALYLSQFTGRLLSADDFEGGVKFFKINRSQADFTDLSSLPGAMVFQGESRYFQKSVSPHLIGYTDLENRGVSGIERLYDGELYRNAKTSAYVPVDAARKMPLNKPVRYEKPADSGNHVVLAIDGDISRMAADAMEKRGYKGAVIITDAVSGDILTLISTPGFNQSNVGAYIGGDGSELLCRYEQSYEPGSVFKIVMAAAALENGLEDIELACMGFEDTDGVIMKCHKEEGHGQETLKEAFANSCNPAFMQLGKKLGYEKIAEMAEKMGLGVSAPAYKGEKPSAGNIPKKYVSMAETANMSIGQGNVQISPLHAAGLLDILVNGGVRRTLNAVIGICNDNEHLIEEKRQKFFAEAIKPDTAVKIKEFMKAAVESGTAGAGRITGMEVAGKTGTAESGWKSADGLTMIHGWYVGILPANSPKYTVTVFVENGGEGGKSAGVVFKEIANYLFDKE